MSQQNTLDPGQQLTVIIDMVHNEVNWERGNVPFLHFVVLSVIMIVAASTMAMAFGYGTVEHIFPGIAIAVAFFSIPLGYEMYKKTHFRVAHEDWINYSSQTGFCSECGGILRPDVAKSIALLYMQAKWIEHTRENIGRRTQIPEVLQELRWLVEQTRNP